MFVWYIINAVYSVNNQVFTVSKTPFNTLMTYFAFYNIQKAHGVKAQKKSGKFQRSSSVAADSTQLMRWRGEGEAHNWCDIQFILWNSRWRSEAKALKEGGEEEKELHSGQTLSETHPATCKNEE